MVAILCNHPLDCFDDRARFVAAGIEVVTYGRPDHMAVDDTLYPLDVAFDPSRGTIEELFAALPRSFEPDVLLIYWPDQQPLPIGIERCPVPVVAVMSDYNLTMHTTAHAWPFFDAVVCDRGGVGLFQALGFAGVHEFVQFSFKAPSHRLYPDVARDLDVAFAGNTNVLIQGERAPYLVRLLEMKARGVLPRVEVVTGVRGEAYGRLLNRARIGFNRSVRGEMNLRAFEVPACGAALLMESSNLEVRDFFEPGVEMLLYDDVDHLEHVVLEALADPLRLTRIASAGHRRVQDYRLSRRIGPMLDALHPLTLCRPTATPAELAFGRARLLALTWADPNVRVAAYVDAYRLLPDDPRVLNDLAVALIQTRRSTAIGQAIDLFRRASELSSRYVPALQNLAWAYAQVGDHATARRYADHAESRLCAGTSMQDRDGVRLPGGFSDTNLAACRELLDDLRASEVLVASSAGPTCPSAPTNRPTFRLRSDPAVRIG